MWVGVEPLGERDGRVALYLTDHLLRLRAPVATRPEVDGRRAEILEYLSGHGASFFSAIHEGTGGGFPAETVDALWDLVWKGLITNDTMQPLRAYARTEETRAAKRSRGTPFRSRRLVPPRAEGRWTLVASREGGRVSKSATTEWATAMAQQLLTRHGIVTRETVAAESVAGGFSAVYQVLKAMEDAEQGSAAGSFVGGLGGAQFAMPAAARSAACDARCAGNPAHGRHGSDRSCQPVRRDREVACRFRHIDGGSRIRPRSHEGRRGTRGDG